MHGNILTAPGFKGRSFKLCVLIRWDFNFCLTYQHWVDVRPVWRLRLDGQNGTRMKSTAMSLTWREIRSTRFYLALKSPWNDNHQPGHARLVTDPVNKDRASTIHQDRGVKYGTSAPSKIHGRDITTGTGNSKTLRAAGKLQEPTHKMDRYR